MAHLGWHLGEDRVTAGLEGGIECVGMEEVPQFVRWKGNKTETLKTMEGRGHSCLCRFDF